MASKFIKAMAPPITATCWRRWVHVNSTAATSVASSLKTTPKKSLLCECRVEKYLIRQGWAALFHDIQIMGVQVDLLMRNPQGVLTLLEVKTQSEGRLAHLSGRQRQRLFRTSAFLAEWGPVDMRLVLVEGRQFTALPVAAL